LLLKELDKQQSPIMQYIKARIAENTQAMGETVLLE